MEKKLVNTAKHLLDLGKRNRLLNYKENGLKSISLLNENQNEVFLNIINGKTYSFFPIDSVLEKYHKDLLSKGEQIEDDPLSYSISKVKNITKDIVKTNQVLAYKTGLPVEKILRSLLKDYKNSLVEKGINSLYLAFGFLKYTEDKNSYAAPLLLIPIEFTKDKNIYKIKEYDDEIIVNPTLDYYLQTSFKISLPVYEDEDLNSYLLKVTNTLSKDFSVECSIALGVFSFLKMNMYNDLVNHQEEVLKNNNIKKLLGLEHTQEEVAFDYPSYPVVNCDSSQLEAIKMATSGKSYVLEGPPGSGKSQTITNIISSLIANNKKVLFVSEKLAALNVVFENLKKAGLSDFALELHSHKASKKAFIDELYRTSILPKYSIDNSINRVYEECEIEKKRLEEYYIELHQSTKYEASLYDIISTYFGLEIEVKDYPLEDIAKYNFKDLGIIVKLLDEYTTLAAKLGADYHQLAFYGYKDEDTNYLRYSFENDLTKSIQYLAKLKALLTIINKNLGLNLVSVKDIYNSLNFLEALVNLNEYQPEYLVVEKRYALINYITKYAAVCDTVDSTVAKQYKDSIFKEDLEDLLATYQKSSTSFFKFLNKDYKLARQTIESYRKTKGKSKYYANELTSLIEYKNKLKELQVLQNNIQSIVNLDRRSYLKTLEQLKALNIFNKDICLSIEEYAKLKPYFTDILISYKSMNEENKLLLSFSSKFDSNIFDLFNLPLSTVEAKMSLMQAEHKNIYDFRLMMDCVKNIDMYHQVGFLNDYLKKHGDCVDLSLTFKKLFYKNKIYELIDDSSILSSFSSGNYETILRDFRENDEKLLLANKDFVFSKNSMNRPDELLLEGSMYSLLVREHNKLKKQKPIRLLLTEIFELATSLKPVFLMSPLSVSTYLAGKDNMFDCVVFDEASQIFSWDALGAIYRAKQCIIIGDTKQMPPSSFFTAMANSDDEADIDDYETELDSILNIASTVFISSKLKWHYRSRSEELITFSNNAFYEHNLITIPQAKKHQKGFGIDFYYLPEGIYDAKSRTNLLEAQRICDMVFEHFANSNQSLGVVAFSNVQAALIEDLIEKRRLSNKEYEKYFSEDLEEPFFVKNLETVQGDERDRIIFSICYGYNKDKKFFQRFGPLNNLGGERRLNVAITRAKYNISVVSSIRNNDINDTTTDSLGVKLLKRYLTYCENISIEQNFVDSTDGIINSIRDFLLVNGYEVNTSFGTSSFKIDLAVKKKEDTDYTLAIMLDSKDKYQTNATDKYRLQKILLERLGWTYFKMYATSWLNNTASEEKRLLEALNNHQEDTNGSSTIVSSSYLVEDDSISSLEASFIEYHKLDELKAKSLVGNTDQLIFELIKQEQPIHEDYLNKEVARLLGKTRVTNVTKNIVQQALTRLDVLRNGKFITLDNLSDIKLRIGSKRDIDYICPDELAHGIVTIVSLNNGISVEGCYKALIKLLGYERMTDNYRHLLDDVIIFLKLDGKIVQRGELLFK